MYSISNQRKQNFVTVPLNLSITKSANLLLDTGAEICIFKVDKADDDFCIDTDNKIKLKGITDDYVESLGVCQAKISLGDSFIIHPFHIVPSNFPIPFDGILGNDLFEKHQVVINFSKSTLKFADGHSLKILPTTTNPTLNNPNDCHSFKSIFTVPGRTELTIKIPIAPDAENPKLCFQKELLPGLFIPNCIVAETDGYYTINVLNTNDESIEFSPKDIELHDLNDYDTVVLSTNVNGDRLKILKTLIQLDHLNPEERDSIIHICREFNDIFHLEGDKLTYTDAIKHTISLLSNKPVYVKPYRLPVHQKPEIRQQIKQMLEDDIIEHSNSPYNSPILIVPKKPDNEGNKKWRLVVDFRKLNDITQSDAHPLPNISEILEQLGTAKYFSVIDLATGFHQILLSEKSKPLTAFSFEGHFQFKRLPMGLKSSPASFQRLMNTVLSGLHGIKCFVYLDDIVVYGSSLRDHNIKLIEVFQRLRLHNLKLQPTKCAFLRREITYLGHLISEHGIKPDPGKVSVVKNYPKPINVDQVRSFLGLASYYRKFIDNFAEIAFPLNQLLKRKVPFQWTALCEESFLKLKEKLVNPPILQFPNYMQEFIVTTDASQNAVGAILSQGEIGKDLPIAYASRTLSKAEKNYSTIERELLAIVYGVQHFRPYLYGKKFKILTDHKPLIYLFSMSNPSSRLMRFRLKLEEYEYEVIYKTGKSNTNADALSRIYSTNIPTENQLRELTYEEYNATIKQTVVNNKNVIDVNSSIDNCSTEFSLLNFSDINFRTENEYHNSLDELKAQNAQVSQLAHLKSDDRFYIYLIIKDSLDDRTSYEKVFYALYNLKSFCIDNSIDKIAISSSTIKQHKLKISSIRTMLRYIFKLTPIQVVICHNNKNRDFSAIQIQELLREYHVTPLGGHQGVNRTFRRLTANNYHWHKMYSDVKKYIRNCEKCQKNKSTTKLKMPMIITDTAHKPFEKVTLDIAGPFTPTENGNKYILTVIDDLSKFLIALPIPNQESKTVAKGFITNVICQHGIPNSILSDQGTNFMGQLFKNICKLLSIKKLHSTSHHPQSQGSVERVHRTLNEYLRSFINKDTDNWDDFLPYAAFTYNTTPHTATKLTPFELVYGRIATLPSALKKQPQTFYNYEDYLLELKSKFQHCHEIARNNLLSSKHKSKLYYDRNTKIQHFSVGDLVLLENEGSMIGKCKKLQPIYTGPHEIISVDSEVNCTILVNRKHVKVHVNRLKKFVANN